MRIDRRVRLLCLMAVCAGSAWGGTKSVDRTVPVSFVKEMEQIPEVDRWTPHFRWTSTEESRIVTEAWARLGPQLAGEVTVERVLGLWRWARDQKSRYVRVAPLEKARLSPAARDLPTRRLCVRAEVETLPSHSPIVTRWLEIYVVWSEGDRTVERVIVTVRGERLE